MATGDNLQYSLGNRAEILLVHALKSLVGSGTNARPGAGRHSLRGMISIKRNASAPTDDLDEDVPNEVGDICLHYDASDVFQAAYICTATNKTTDVTWVKLSA